MHEQSDEHEVHEKIMDLQVVQDMDAHEQAALAKEIDGQPLSVLEKKLNELSDR